MRLSKLLRIDFGGASCGMLSFCFAEDTAEVKGPTIIPETLTPGVIVDTKAEPMAPGKFEPTWDSLKQYRTPEWFRNAKFGIWAHWGPQCQPEAGDWYARKMYEEGSDQYNFHLARYGHPSRCGFKDVIHAWQAGKWDPDTLVALYNRYHPDLIYMDDTALPLWPVSDAGLKIAAHFYNRNTAWHHGDLRAVLCGKILNEEQRTAIVWDIEGRVPATGYPFAWQTCACIGSWHYDRGVYDKGLYKSAKSVIQMLVDIVSKNGNLLLSIPMRGDGSIDDKEEKILNGIAAWMEVNNEAIFGTRPWKLFGEGPAVTATLPPKDGEAKPFTAADVRFTTKGETLYAILLDNPGTQEVFISTLVANEGRTVKGVSRLGYTGTLEWHQDATGLRVTMPNPQHADHVAVLKIIFKT